MTDTPNSWLWGETEEALEESVEVCVERNIDGDMQTTNSLLLVIAGQLKRIGDILEVKGK